MPRLPKLIKINFTATKLMQADNTYLQQLEKTVDQLMVTYFQQAKLMTQATEAAASLHPSPS